MSDHRIIRTLEELEALDANTVLTAFRADGVDVIFRAWDAWQNDDTAHFPAVVICSGEQLFSARNALQKGDRMTDRPDYCCGMCPAVEPNPEHLDCEACRTGYDCTCRDDPKCPNYQGD